MYEFPSIRHLHLEITTRCNAGCPMCPRHYTYTSILREDLGNVNMTLESAKRVLQESLISKLTYINFCGNYGDAIVNRDFIPIVEHIRSINPKVHITLTTNGGARNADFWLQTANLVDQAVFGIDGLRDTNHLYRQFVNWDTLERNVQAYTEESERLGKKRHSQWVMNVYRHNQHQIEEAKQTSKQWRVHQFVQRYTDRFATYGSNGVTHWPIYDKDQKLTHVIYPSNSDGENDVDMTAMNRSMSWIKKTAGRDHRFEISDEDYEKLEKRHGNDKVMCRVAGHGHGGLSSVYIDYAGKLYPCCYFGSAVTYAGEARNQQIVQMYDKFGPDFNDLNKNTVESVFESGIFEEIEMSWHKKDIKCGKSAVCIYKCGAKSHHSKIVT